MQLKYAAMISISFCFNVVVASEPSDLTRSQTTLASPRYAFTSSPAGHQIPCCMHIRCWKGCCCKIWCCSCFVKYLAATRVQAMDQNRRFALARLGSQVITKGHHARGSSGVPTVKILVDAARRLEGITSEDVHNAAATEKAEIGKALSTTPTTTGPLTATASSSLPSPTAPTSPGMDRSKE